MQIWVGILSPPVTLKKSRGGHVKFCCTIFNTREIVKQILNVFLLLQFKKRRGGGGVIFFVVEAYRLIPMQKSDDKDYGLEALEEIMSVMDCACILMISAR